MALPYSPSIVTFHGNGVATQFPFSFKVWNVGQIALALTSPGGTVTEPPFTATLTDTGGTVTFLLNGAPLPVGWRLSVTRNMSFEQQVDLISGTRFDPQVIEDALDTAAAERQQLREAIGRAVLVPPGNAEPPELLAQQVFDARESALASAGKAAVSESHAEAATVEALAARDASLAIVEGATNKGLGSLSTLRDTSLVEINNLGTRQKTEITQAAEIKLAELAALAINMETIGNKTMADVASAGDAQEVRVRGEASQAVARLVLEGDSQAQRITATATPLINEAKTEADRAQAEAVRAQNAAAQAVDMTGVGMASKTHFGLAKAGSGIEVNNGVFSIKFPRVVSTPVINFVAAAGIGYSYTVTLSATTGAAGCSIDHFRLFVDNAPEVRVPALNGAGTHTVTVSGLDGSVGNITASAVDSYTNASDDGIATFTKHAVVKQAPRIVQPVNGDVDVALQPTLTLQALVVTGLPATAAATQVRIATEASFAAGTLVYDTGEIGYTLSHAVATSLPAATPLFLQARHKADFYGWSAYGSSTAITTIAKAVSTPSVISPPNASMGQSVTPTLVLSALESTGIVDTPTNTQVQIARDNLFAELVFDSLQTGPYSTSVSVDSAHALQPTRSYYARVRHKGQILGWSAWSLVISFSTLDAYTCTPQVEKPLQGATDVPLCPAFAFSAFSNVGPGDTGQATHFQLSSGADFQNLLMDTGEQGPFVQSLNAIAELPLNTLCYARVRYKGQLWGWSAWSAVRTFVTVNASISQPAVLSPAEGSTTDSLKPLCTFSDFAWTGVSDSPAHTQFQLARDAAFVDVIDAAPETGPYCTSYSPAMDLPLNTPLWLRVRHQGTRWGWSPWSAARTFVTVNAYLHIPQIVSPAEGATGVELTPVVSFSAPQCAGQAVPRMEVQFSTSQDFVPIAQTSGQIAWADRYTPSTDLTKNTRYFCRVRYEGAVTGWSGWSAGRAFTTTASLHGRRLDGKATLVGKADGSPWTVNGKQIWIAVVDAAFRTFDSVYFGASQVTAPAGVASMTGPGGQLAPGESEEAMDARYPKEVNTSAHNNDQWLAAYANSTDAYTGAVGLPMISACRAVTLKGQPCNLPSIKILARIWQMRNFVDEHDPTAAGNPSKKLSNWGFNSASGPAFQSSTQDKSQHTTTGVYSDGRSGGVSRQKAWPFFPVLEIDA